MNLNLGIDLSIMAQSQSQDSAPASDRVLTEDAGFLRTESLGYILLETYGG